MQRRLLRTPAIGTIDNPPDGLLDRLIVGGVRVVQTDRRSEAAEPSQPAEAAAATPESPPPVATTGSDRDAPSPDELPD